MPWVIITMNRHLYAKKIGYKAIIATDSNINYADSRSTAKHKLDEMLTNNGATQLINTVTRPASKTILDHIFITGNISRYTASTVASSVSDHMALTLMENKPQKCDMEEGIRVKYILSKENLMESQRILNETDWYRLNRESPKVNSFAECVSSKFFEAMEKCKTVTSHTSKKAPAFWFDKDLQIMKRKCQKAMIRLRNKQGLKHEKEYSKLHKEYKQMIATKKREYYSNRFLSSDNDPKKIWNTIKEVTGQNRQKNKLTSVVENEQTVTGKDMAEAFNSFYISVPKKLENRLNQSSNHFTHYLMNARKAETKLDLEQIDREEILKALKQIKPKYSKGHDGITSAFLKKVMLNAIDPLYILYNRCIAEGEWPACFKVARVIPIYKGKGRTDKIENYRPISLLHSVSKVLERILHGRIYSHVESLQLLNNNQYGFRKGHCTQNAIQSLTNKAQSAMAQKHKVSICFLDISKAFDCINHDILLSKLQFYGLTNEMTNLLKSYLTKRQQYTDIDGTISEVKAQNNIGVPQGSILGPLLFILYVNDLAFMKNHYPNFYLTLFADDTAALQISQNTNSLNHEMSTNLEEVSDWFASNKLTLNVKKTELLAPGQAPEQTNILLQGTKLNPVEHAKYLGVQLDNRLNFNIHVIQLAKKMKKINYMLDSTKSYLNKQARIHLFNALVKSNVEYCSLVWGNLASKYSLNQLNAQYKHAIRTTALASYREHTSKLCKQMGILKLQDHLELRTYKHHEQVLQNNAPKQIQSLYTVRRLIALRNNVTLKPNGQDKLSSVITQLFNKLPNKTRQKSLSKEGMTTDIVQLKLDDYADTCEIRDCYACKRQ